MKQALSPRSGLAYRMLYFLFVLFLATEVFAGLLRHVLQSVNLSVLAYVPKALLLLAFPLIPLVRGRLSVGFIMVALGSFVFLMLGILVLRSPLQACFGLWVIAPFVFGILAGPALMAEPKRFMGAMMFLFVCALIGLAINCFVNYPWVGSDYQLGTFDIEEARQWTAGGFSRLAGFSRASYNVAGQLLVFGICAVFMVEHRLLRLAAWFAAGVGIALTTSKGPLGAWLLVSLYLLSRRYGWRRAWDSLFLLVMAVMVLLPLSTLAIRYQLHFSDPLTRLLLSSFGDRLSWMWPRSLHLLKEPWQWFTGLGLGGVGAPQMFFDPTNYLSADSFFVYCVVDFGLPVSLFILVSMAWKAIRDNRTPFPAGGLVFALLLAILSRSGVSNLLEDSVPALFLALAMATPLGMSSALPASKARDTSYDNGHESLDTAQ